MPERSRNPLVTILGVLLCALIASQAFLSWLQPPSVIAAAIAIGLVMCFISCPASDQLKGSQFDTVLRVALSAIGVLCCGYVILRSEPFFQGSGVSQFLGEGGSRTAATDLTVGLVGLSLAVEALRRSLGLVVSLGVLLCVFTLYEVNFPKLQFQSALAVFVGIGLVMCFLTFPVSKRLKGTAFDKGLSALFAIAAAVCCGFVVHQSESIFESQWLLGKMLGNRAGQETTIDFAIGLTGLIVVLEATRRSIGIIVPLLALSFIAHSYYCYLAQNHGLPPMPDWLLPHAGQKLKDISSTCFLQSLGVFGPAATVMFKYVFLFVIFGSFLEMSGATQFIIDFAERVFGRSPGGPAKVSVLGSGLMGSLSGSAVANAVTTGSFTIPMMRNSGFSPTVAGGITAAAAAGGALVPPVMGAGAYMMLELVQPQVTFPQVATAAAIPAVLYYLSIFLIVHFYSRMIGVSSTVKEDAKKPLSAFEAFVFGGALATLVYLLIIDFSPFRAVTGALVFILATSIFRKELPMGIGPRGLALAVFVGVAVYYRFNAETVADPTGEQILGVWLEASIWGMFGLLAFGLLHPAWRPSILEAFTKSAKNGVSLVAASACVGIIIGIVQQTGIATDFSVVIKGVVQSSLFLALVGIMVCSIILGMGVPSVVCYLLMATLMGSLLSEMGVIPLAAHLFIFYFGMMSMVTPPVALAAYASASIAQADIMPTAFAAFRFSLVGFTLPFMFVYRPELLLMSNKPEVKMTRVEEAAAADGKGKLTGQLTKFGKPLQQAKLTLTTDGGEPTTIQTDDYGNFQIETSTGELQLAFIDPKGNPRRLGVVSYDPDRDGELFEMRDGRKRLKRGLTTEQKDFGPYTSDPRVSFEDQRLNLTDVFIAVGIAIVGIVALAAGIAGFLFTKIRLPVRIGMLAAAGLLLSPDIDVGETSLGLYANIAGGALFAITAAINFIRSRGQREEMP